MSELKNYLKEGVAIVVAVLLVIFALLYESSVYRQLEHGIEEERYKSRLVWQMEQAVRDRVLVLHVMLLLNDPFERDDRYEEFSSRAQDFMIAWRSLQKLSLSSEESKALETLNRVAWRSSVLQRDVIDLLQIDQQSQAQRRLLSDVVPAQQQVFSAIEELLYLFQQSIQMGTFQRITDYRRAEFMLVLSIFLLVAVVGSIAWGWRCNVAQMKRALSVVKKERVVARQTQQEKTIKGAVDEEEIEQIEVVSEVAVAEHKKLCILVAEDNLVNQQVVTLMLEQLGYSKSNVDVAANGVEVLDALTAKFYDLILMDLQMPIMGGEEATQKILESASTAGSRPRIVAMTASALSGDRERCLALGMDDYLTKPVSLSRLSEALAVSRNSGVSIPICQAVDVSALESLRVDMVDGASVLVELLNNFFSESKALLLSLQQAMEESSDERMLHAVHTLKSSSLSLGALSFSKCCRILEQQLRQDKVVALESQIKVINIEYRRVCEDFNTLLRYYEKQ